MSAAVPGLEKQKLKEGKDLIRCFCTPAKAGGGGTSQYYSTDNPEKWAVFKTYNHRDVETEMGIRQKLAKPQMPESERGVEAEFLSKAAVLSLLL